MTDTFSDLPYEQLTFADSTVKPRNRKFRILCGVGLIFCVLCIICGLTGFFLFRGNSNANNVQETLNYQNTSPLPSLKLSTIMTPSTIKGSKSFVSQQNEMQEFERTGNTMASIRQDLKKITETLRNQSKNQTSSAKHNDTQIDISHLFDEAVDTFMDQALHPSTFEIPSIRISLFQNNKSAYYGRIYTGTDGSVFNTVFDTSLDMLTLPSILPRDSECPTQHCYVSKKDVHLIQAGNANVMIGLHRGDIYFHRDSTTKIESHVIIEDFSPKYSKADQIDGNFGLKISSQNESNPENPIENFFIQNPKVKKMFSLWYSEDVEPSLISGELVIGDIDRSRFVGSIHYVPVKNTGRWEVSIEGVSFDDKNWETLPATVSFDSNSQYLIGPKHQVLLIAEFLGFKEAKDRTFVMERDENCEDYNLEDLVSFRLGGAVVELRANNLIERDGKHCKVLLAYHDNNDEDWSFGVPYFRTYYTTFDLENSRIGIARQSAHKKLQ